MAPKSSFYRRAFLFLLFQKEAEISMRDLVLTNAAVQLASQGRVVDSNFFFVAVLVTFLSFVMLTPHCDERGIHIVLTERSLRERKSCRHVISRRPWLHAQASHRTAISLSLGRSIFQKHHGRNLEVFNPEGCQEKYYAVDVCWVPCGALTPTLYRGPWA